MDIRLENSEIVKKLKEHKISFDQDSMWQNIKNRKRKKRPILLFFSIILSIFILMLVYNFCIKKSVNRNSNIVNLENIKPVNSESKDIGLSINNNRNLKDSKTTKNKLNSKSNYNSVNEEIVKNNVDFDFNSNDDNISFILKEKKILPSNKYFISLTPLNNTNIKSVKSIFQKETKLIPDYIILSSTKVNAKNKFKLITSIGLRTFKSSIKNKSKFENTDQLDRIQNSIKPLEIIDITIKAQKKLNNNSYFEIGIGYSQMTEKFNYIDEDREEILRLNSVNYQSVKKTTYNTFNTFNSINLNCNIGKYYKNVVIKTGLNYTIYNYQKGHSIDHNNKVIAIDKNINLNGNVMFNLEVTYSKKIFRNIDFNLGSNLHLGLKDVSTDESNLSWKYNSIGINFGVAL